MSCISALGCSSYLGTRFRSKRPQSQITNTQGPSSDDSLITLAQAIFEFYSTILDADSAANQRDYMLPGIQEQLNQIRKSKKEVDNDNRFSKKSCPSTLATFRMIKEKNGAISLYFYGDRKTLLGEGGHRSVKDAYEIWIFPDDRCRVDDQWTIQRSHKSINAEHGAEHIERGVEIHKKIQGLLWEKCHHQKLFICSEYKSSEYESYSLPGVKRTELLQRKYFTSLDKLSDKSNITYAQCLSVFKNVAMGLHQIHMTGHTHNDIKSSNVFLNSDLEGVVADFDIATEIGGIDRKTRSSIDYYLWGHSYYRAIKTPHNDVFGLSIALIQTLTTSLFSRIIKQPWLVNGVTTSDGETLNHFIDKLETCMEDPLNFFLKYQADEGPNEVYQQFRTWLSLEPRTKDSVAQKLGELYILDWFVFDRLYREFINSKRLLAYFDSPDSTIPTNFADWEVLRKKLRISSAMDVYNALDRLYIKLVTFIPSPP